MYAGRRRSTLEHVSATDRATLKLGESAERGRAARLEAPRSAHGDWAPAPDRPDPVAVLQAQAATRLQELVPIRYGRMLVSPFTFYRGAAAVMAADLATTPDSGIVVQACGDAHISNFGGFAAPDRRLIFGPNDFDETLPGPWEWDVKRMAASVEIAGRDVGLPADRRRQLVTACVREYREAMRGFARVSHLDVWYERINASELVDRFGGRLGRKGRILFAQPFAKARRKTSLRALSKLTEQVDGKPRFRSVPPLLVRFADLHDPTDPRGESDYVRDLLDQYVASLDEDRRYLFGTYEFVDMARKVVGVGSVGTRAWVLLFAGRGGRDALVLQMKEAQASVLEPYLGASEFDHHGERVVRGQRMDQAVTDVFLGWQRSQGPRRQGARLLHPAAVGLEGVGGSDDDALHRTARVRSGVWLVAGAGARPLGRPARDRRVRGRRREVRRGARPFLEHVRRSERARSSATRRGGLGRRGPGPARRLDDARRRGSGRPRP